MRNELGATLIVAKEMKRIGSKYALVIETDRCEAINEHIIQNHKVTTMLGLVMHSLIEKRIGYDINSGQERGKKRISCK